MDARSPMQARSRMVRFHGIWMRARWCTKGLPSSRAPKSRSQKRRQPLSGFGVHQHSSSHT